MEKLGMRREGVLREKHNFKGRYWDELLYGMLADEYRR
jgi:RimJ/RimL family protein N-acetyltransferase